MLRNEEGFTIIELLLVFLVAVLFVNISSYTYGHMSRRQLSMAARDIQTSIRIAQDHAYGEQNTYTLIFYPESDECYYVRSSKILKEIKMPHSISMDFVNFPSNKLWFSGKLRPNSGGTIKLSSKNHQVRITVLPVTGRVKIYPVTKK